jgi:predicted DNA-binding ribbon-helix-helix protein
MANGEKSGAPRCEVNNKPLPIRHSPFAMNKRSLTVAGHRTSLSLEPEFWEALRRAAAERRMSLAALVAEIDAARGRRNLSSAVRVWLLGQGKA